MFPAVQHAIVGEELQACDGQLRGFRRGQLRDREYPGIIESPNESVVGKVLMGIRTEFMELLDKYEGFEFRRAKGSALLSNGEEIEVCTYAWALTKEDVLLEDWDPVRFQREKLHTFVQYIIRDYSEPPASSSSTSST